MTPERKKVLLIDGNNMFFRGYTANPSLNTNGQHVGAITGFFYSLQKCVKDTRPHQIIVIWDGKGGSKKRQEIRPDYKDGRKVPKPLRLNRALDVERSEEEEKDSLRYQQGKIIELLNCLPVLQLCEPGVEADDFVSYLCRYYSCAENYLKIIVSNDKDFIQLLDVCTILYRPIKQEFVTYKSALAEHKIHPQNMALARAIAGDSSDNLDGVPRVGLKTVAKIMPEFANEEQVGFDTLKELCEKLKSKEKPSKKPKETVAAHDAILNHMEKVESNYKIMQLYMPMVPAETGLRVKEQVEDFKMEISMDKFMDMMKKEGIFGSSFVEIAKHGKHMIRENQR